MAAQEKPIFCDMVHSNNAARIRLWIKFSGLDEEIETRMITYPMLQTEEYKQINPLRKVPGYMEGEMGLFESYVILNYLVDKYSERDDVPSFTMPTAQGRAMMELIIRIHDIYIASPNCSQPGFAHTQGCMYLAPYETPFCPAFRVMSRDRRAKKLAEIFKHLTWLEGFISEEGPYMCGENQTLADFTWFPTVIFMEYMLPRVYAWPDVFNDPEAGFPKLCRWFAKCKEHEIYQSVRSDIWDFWVVKDEAGQFEPIKEEVAASKAEQDGWNWDFDDVRNAHNSK